MSSVKASSYTSTSIGIAYTAPFIGGIIADGFLGDYWSIIVGVIFFYIPGLVLISLTTFPGLLGASFNMNVLTAGLLALMPIGTGELQEILLDGFVNEHHRNLTFAGCDSLHRLHQVNCQCFRCKAIPSSFAM